jgi:Lrp/AsnC family transcriptional regulator, leucine-responsive regulatory protein
MNLRSTTMLTDARNVELLKLLSGDPRMTISALARRVGMSAPAVRERLRRLSEVELIRGYRMDIDPRALGFPLTAFVRIRPLPGKLPKIIELAQRTPQVTECHRVTGEDCFILRIHFASLEGLDQLLDQFLAFGQTTTSLVQSTPVPARSLPLPGERRR